MTPSCTSDVFAEPPAHVRGEQAPTPVLLLCDHASNHIPEALGALGLRPAALDSHIAYDPGAAAVTERITERLDAACVLCGYSRLLIDVNRDPTAQDSIVIENDGIRVPGNVGLDAAERRQRRAKIYEPYHSAVNALLERRANSAGTQLVIGVHSFTPVMGARRRPWDIGLVFDRDRRMARALVAELVGIGDGARLTLGLNEPYAPDDHVYHTLKHHAEKRRLPNVMVEVANDQIATPEGRELWAERLAGAIQATLPKLVPAGQGCGGAGTR